MSNTILPYLAGVVNTTTQSIKVDLEIPIIQLLIYPTTESKVSMNGGSTPEVFLPKGMWTPIQISRDFFCTDFMITSEVAGKIYWQGWVI